MKTAVHFLLAASLLAVQARSEEAKLTCSAGLTLARGPVDEAVFSRGVWAEWCERDDASGRSERLGRFIERRPDGALRLAAREGDGHIELRHPGGGLAGEARFQACREEGAERSFYSRARGGGLRSEVQVEADPFVGLHRTFDLEGNETLRAAPYAAPQKGSIPMPVTVPAPASLV